MSLPPHNSSPETAGYQSPGQEFNHQERGILLRLAHDAIVAALAGAKISVDPPTAHFAERRGVFTSLYSHAELRGCVGYVIPTSSVYEAVAGTASAAAFNDNRFQPITAEEAGDLEIELSILSPPQAISAEQIEAGRHGLLISWRGHRGLLLPQVAVEHEWDRVTFLQQTCRKAGLPKDAWELGATIEAFTAEVFGDKSGL